MSENTSQPVLNYGMVGGGLGAFIGDVHRKGANFDGLTHLIAGCFSRDLSNSKETAMSLGVKANRVYSTFEEMAEKEAERKDGIDFVVIVTPNHSHYAIAKAFLEKGIHVMCDKPLTINLAEAEDLARLAQERDLLFGLTYTNAGYPLIKQARELIRSGQLGDIRMVMAEYPQEGLANPTRKGNPWRFNPELSGPSLSVGDVGVHIEHLVAYMTGLKIDSLCAQFDYFGNAELDSNSSILLKYDNGASGMYWCSKIAIGHTNGLKIRIFGSEGSIEWEQIHPNEMHFTKLGQPTQIIVRGRDALNPEASKFSRLPGGHPEGVYEAFGNLYKEFAEALQSKKAGSLEWRTSLFPNVQDGVQGVKFVEKCVQSAKSGAQWVRYSTAQEKTDEC